MEGLSGTYFMYVRVCTTIYSIGFKNNLWYRNIWNI